MLVLMQIKFKSKQPQLGKKIGTDQNQNQNLIYLEKKKSKFSSSVELNLNRIETK